MSRLRRRFAALTVSLALVGGTALFTQSAAGAAPSNDTQAGAVAIPNTLPFHYTEDTTQATVDAGESVASSYCLGIGAPAFEHAVWFKGTVPADPTKALRVDVSASDYGAGVALLLESGGMLIPLSCSPGVLITGIPSGGTYYYVVFGDGTTPATGGNLDLTVDFLPPPPDIAVTINPNGTATKQGGAWISGTVNCSGGANGQVFEVDGKVTQTVGRLIISSDFFSSASIPCDGVSYPWQAYVPPTNGKFSGGKTLTVSSAFGCNDGGCNAGFAEAKVKLNRAAIK